MAERATVFQKVQIGIESTKGTGVAATKIVTATEFTMGPKFDVKTYRPSGYRFPTVASLSKEWMEAKLSGPITYSELVYWLSSGMKTITPATASGATTCAFDIATNAANTTKSFTVEMGSAERAHKFAYGQLTSFGMSFDRDENKFTGTMMGKAMQDAITLTALTSAAEIALKPVMPTETSFKIADTAAGLAGATALTRGFSAEFSLDNLFGVVYPVNATATYAADVPLVPSSKVSLFAAADSEAMALLANVRSGDTKFLRITATGPQIGAGPATYSLVADLAVKFKETDDFSDEQGVFALKYNGELAHDSTFGKALAITVINEVPSL